MELPIPMDSSLDSSSDALIPSAVDAPPAAPARRNPLRTLERASQWMLREALRTSSMPAPMLERGDWLYLGAMFVLTRGLIIFLGLLGTALFPQLLADGTFALHPLQPGDDLWARLFVHFDSGWYLGISHGYPLPNSSPDWLKAWAFFPLYSLALHPVSLVIGALHIPGSPDVLAGVLVSHAALFAAIVYLYRLACAELSTASARRTVAYLLVFPASFFFSAVYTESLFLLVSVAAFYHMRRRQWALAAVFAALAALTRPQGLFLVLPLALELAAQYRGRGTWRAMLGAMLAKGWWLCLPVLTLGAYAVYSRSETGYWLAFATSASMAWGHQLTPPVYPLVRYLLAPDLGGALSYDFRSVNFAVAVVFLALVVVAWRRLPASYTLWLLLCVLFPLSANGHYFFSLARYVSTAFPAFIALAAWSVGERWTPKGTVHEAPSPLSLDLRDRLVLIPSLLLLPLYVVMFVNGIFAAI